MSSFRLVLMGVHPYYVGEGCRGGSPLPVSSPHFSPVIYCGPKYAAIFSVFLKSLDQRTVRYASLVHSAKTPNITTSSAPRDENW